MTTTGIPMTREGPVERPSSAFPNNSTDESPEDRAPSNSGPGLNKEMEHKTRDVRSFASRHSDWIVYYDDEDDKTSSSTITPTTPTPQAHATEGDQELKDRKMPTQSFTFFVPTTIAPRTPMAPDAAYDSWYGPSSLGTILAAREREIEAQSEKAEHTEAESSKRRR